MIQISVLNRMTVDAKSVDSRTPVDRVLSDSSVTLPHLDGLNGLCSMPGD